MVLRAEDLTKQSALIAATQTSEEGFQAGGAGTSEGHKKVGSK